MSPDRHDPPVPCVLTGLGSQHHSDLYTGAPFRCNASARLHLRILRAAPTVLLADMSFLTASRAAGLGFS